MLHSAGGAVPVLFLLSYVCEGVIQIPDVSTTVVNYILTSQRATPLLEGAFELTSMHYYGCIPTMYSKLFPAI